MDSHFDVEKLLMDESFIDYCLNKGSLHRQKWEELIANEPTLRKSIEEARELILLLAPNLPKSEISAEVEKMRSLISSRNKAVVNDLVGSGNVFHTDQSPNKKKRKTLKILAYTASIVLLGAAVIYGLNSNRKIAVTFEAGLNYQTGMGERREFKLPDGSIAVLNSNTSITLAKDFNERDRRINISGEAFFKVAKNADKPFTVVCPEFSTTALGTSFYVHGLVNNGNYAVELLEGKVKLTPSIETESATLNAGETAEWQKDKSAFARKKFDSTELRQWLEGNLSFKKMPAEQVIRQLEKWYAVDIDVQRKNWKQVFISGDYQDAPLEDVLKVICFTQSWEYAYNGNKIIIR
jgi:transmembrane sensor